MQFPTKNGSQIDLDISYANNTNLMTKKKFLGRYVESTLSENSHATN